MSKGYLLIDGVSWREALPDLYCRTEPLKIEPLYSGTQFVALQDLGPILVQINAPSTLMREWANSSELQSRSSLLFSWSPMQEVSTHLRRFIRPSDRNGGTSLLRFCAPLVLHQWLSSYSSTALDQILGPIERIQIKTPRHSWESPANPSITHFIRQESPALWQEHFAVLGETQLQALLHLDSWKFEERLYLWLMQCSPQTFASLDTEQISRWLTHVLASGQAWGLITEEGLMTWILMCAGWGEDFATRSQGPYRQWLKREPEHGRLSADLRIAALDDYRQLNPMTKETVHD